MIGVRVRLGYTVARYCAVVVEFGNYFKVTIVCGH